MLLFPGYFKTIVLTPFFATKMSWHAPVFLILQFYSAGFIISPKVYLKNLWTGYNEFAKFHNFFNPISKSTVGEKSSEIVRFMVKINLLGLQGIGRSNFLEIKHQICKNLFLKNEKKKFVKEFVKILTLEK